MSLRGKIHSNEKIQLFAYNWLIASVIWFVLSLVVGSENYVEESVWVFLLAMIYTVFDYGKGFD